MSVIDKLCDASFPDDMRQRFFSGADFSTLRTGTSILQMPTSESQDSAKINIKGVQNGSPPQTHNHIDNRNLVLADMRKQYTPSCSVNMMLSIPLDL
jgi:hypothetical protein